MKIINGHLIVVLAILFVIFTSKIATHPISDNDASRLAGIISIVQNNKLPIDSTPYNNIGDRVVYKNISYSSKPPVLHVLLGLTIKLAFILKPVLTNNQVAIYRLATLLTNIFPLILIYAFFYNLLRRNLNLSSIKSDLLTLFLVFGTLIFSYSQFLTNHILETLLQLVLFSLLLNFENTKIKLASIGILISALFAVDITNGIFVAPITIAWLIYYKNIKVKDLFWIVLGAIPLTITHFYLNYTQFENFLPPQLFPNKYLNYENSKWLENAQGFEILNDPFIIRLFNYTIGTHGLFLYVPVLIWPFILQKSWKNPLFIYVVAITIAYILFNTLMQKNYAGSAFGPRRFLPLIPLLYFFTIKNLSENWLTIDSLKKSLVILTFVLTFLISLLGYKNPWNNYSVRINSQKVYFPILYTLESN